MQIEKVHCLFEQSGTFKNAFIGQGIPAEDYDIKNDFGQTDHVIDLFAEINKAYDGEKSIFDGISKNDLIFCFFPCTRFQSFCCANMQGRNHSMINWSDIQRLNYSIQLHGELHLLYVLICKLFVVVLRGGYNMILENPYTQPHYLTLFFPMTPAVIIPDRTAEGDYYKKPTQFYFVNCEPESNIVFEPIKSIKIENIERIAKADINDDLSRQVKRSLIHPQFAERFIKSYVLDKAGGIWLGVDNGENI